MQWCDAAAQPAGAGSGHSPAAAAPRQTPATTPAAGAAAGLGGEIENKESIKQCFHQLRSQERGFW